jgi:hypothetical protein
MRYSIPEEFAGVGVQTVNHPKMSFRRPGTLSPIIKSFLDLFGLSFLDNRGQKDLVAPHNRA